MEKTAFDVSCASCEHLQKQMHMDEEVSRDETYTTFWCSRMNKQVYLPKDETCGYRVRRYAENVADKYQPK